MSKTAKAALGLLIFTFASKGLGFVRDILIASKYGASSLNDIFITAQNIPILLFSVVTAAVMTGYMPLYMSAKGESKKSSEAFTTSLLFGVGGISLMLGTLGWIFMPFLVKLIAFGFEGEKFALTVHYSRILMVSVVFTGTASVLRAYHQAEGKYILSSINTLLNNIIVIGVFFFIASDGIEWIVIGTLVGLSLDFFIQWIAAKQGGFALEKGPDLKNPYLMRFYAVIAPVVVGTMIGQVSIIIDNTMASTLADGSITYINTAFKLMTFVNGIFAVSLGTVIYPMLSNFSATENMQAYKWSLLKAINMIMLMITPIMVLTMVLSVPVVQFLFERGKFDNTDTRATAAALVCFAVGMIGLGLREVLSKAFYSLQDTKTPMINGAIAVGLNIGLNFLFIGTLKHAGLALASSIAVTATSLMLLHGLRKKLGRINGKRMLLTASKNLFAGLCMGLAVWGFDFLLTGYLGLYAEKGSVDHSGLLIELTLDTLVGFSVYLLVVWLLKVEEVHDLLNKIKLKFVPITKI